MFRPVIVLASALALAACGKAATEGDNPPGDATPRESAEAVAAASTASAAEVPAAFLQCKTCHSVEAGQNLIGPSLAGVHGRPAGATPRYTYSAAMKASGLTWDDATLDRFLEAPARTVPGTKMVYPGLEDAAKRAEVIGYLKTL